MPLSVAKRAAVLLISLAALLPCAQASPFLALADAAGTASGCGMLASACCCGTPSVPNPGGCTCTPLPERAPAPVPAPPTDDGPRVPDLHGLPAVIAADLVPTAASAHGVPSRLSRPDGAPPGRLLYCVFRL